LWFGYSVRKPRKVRGHSRTGEITYISKVGDNIPDLSNNLSVHVKVSIYYYCRNEEVRGNGRDGGEWETDQDIPSPKSGQLSILQEQKAEM
jgi:hypothetical protein